MFENGFTRTAILLSLCALSLFGCTGTRLIVTRDTDLSVLLEESYRGKYRILAGDSTIAMDGKLDPGLVGTYLSNKEMAELGVPSLPSSEK